MSGTDQALSFAAPLYPLDKIYYRPSPASVTVAQSANPIAPTFTAVSITNPKSETFFIAMQISVDNSTWYDADNEPLYYDVTHMAPFKRFVCLWAITTATITIKLAALDAAYTMYYRFVGYSKD